MGGSFRWLFACVLLVSALAVGPARAGDRDLHDGTHNDPEMRRTVEGWRRDLDREIASIENDATLIEGIRLYEMGLWINSLGSPDSVDVQHQTGDAEQGKKRGEWLIAPVPFRNPTLGWGIAGTVAWIHQPDPDDTVSPPSILGLGGMYTENDSTAGFLFYKGFLAKDTWRVSVAGGGARINYDFFGIGNGGGDDGVSIPLQTKFTGVKFEAMRRIGRGLFLGPEFIYGKTKSKLGGGVNLPPELRPKAFDVTSSSVGLHTQWDTRDNTFYATAGRLLDFNARVFHDAWGSSFDYEVMEFAYNVYRSIGEDTVIATRLYAKGTFGDVPFFALSQFGKKSDLRGYQAGRWRDRHMYAAQIEIRRKIWKRVGAVAWVGAGGVFNDFDGLFDTVLPSAGVGLRFKLTNQNPINYRIDFAWGRDQATVYFAVGEAF